MIQDFLTNLIPRIEVKFKERFYISDDNGNILLTDNGKLLGLPTDQNTFTLKFKYSTPTEWIAELDAIPQSSAEMRYPFLYVNSMRVTQGDLIKIPEIVLAINSNRLWSSSQRDEYSFKPILNHLYDIFIEGCRLSHDFSMVNIGTRIDHYFYGKTGIYGGDASKFHDHVDAIEINNLQIRLYKKCYDI